MQRGSRFFFFPTTRALSLFDLAKTTLVALPLPTPHTFAFVVILLILVLLLLLLLLLQLQLQMQAFILIDTVCSLKNRTTKPSSLSSFFPLLPLPLHSPLLLLPAPPYRRLLGQRVRVVRLELHLVVAPLVQLRLDDERPQEVCGLGGVGEGLVDLLLLLLLLLAAPSQAGRAAALIEARAELFARGGERDGIASEG